MIVGKVNPRRRLLVLLEVRGPDGQSESVEFQVDTGFTGSLLLPMETVQHLGLAQTVPAAMRLADNSRVEVVRYLGRVVWDGTEQTVATPASGRQPLLGTGLLDGHRLCSDITPSGRVTIEPL